MIQTSSSLNHSDGCLFKPRWTKTQWGIDTYPSKKTALRRHSFTSKNAFQKERNKRKQFWK